MSRPLIIASILLVTLAGCAAQPNIIVEVPPAPDPQTCTCEQLQKWLELEDHVSNMSAEQVRQQLASLDDPKGSWQQFYFGLLKQQLDEFVSWTQARDTFRELAADNGLVKEQRDLVTILQRYNQTRINWYQQHRELLADHETTAAKLDASLEENRLLQQKIQALTDVETSISTRKDK
jgi:hypothetical protein